MVLHFNVDSQRRKKMVEVIQRILGIKPKYLGVPSCAYKIGNFIVGKNGELKFDDSIDLDLSSTVIDACVCELGVSPQEWDENSIMHEESPEIEILGHVLAYPIEGVKVSILESLIESKKELIKKALGVNSLQIDIDEEKLSFPWFSEIKNEDEFNAYSHFIEALCKMSKKLKRVNESKNKVENEKYSFRCFLLRLGFIGDEYKKDRKILLRNMVGSSAFKKEDKNEVSK